MDKIKLSVVLATRNEEEHLGECLTTVGKLANEIIVVDEHSSDKTIDIAKSFGAKVLLEPHHAIFHITKQKAIDKARGDWILLLDADERVTEKLEEEIKKVVKLNQKELDRYESNLSDKRLFDRHTKIIEARDGKVGKSAGEYVAFFLPRSNYFLGRYLRYGGVYPDGVIRLFKRGKAYLPCKDVHEQMAVDGRVGWLASPLLHVPDRSFKRYLKRNSRYINLMVGEMKEQRVKSSLLFFLSYMVILPVRWFFLTLVRHKGILDSWQGIVFSFFSALRFPRAYIRYISTK